MIVLINVVSIICIVFGILFLMPKAQLVKIDQKANRLIINMDKFLVENHVGIGISLLCVAAFLFFMAYSYSIKA